MKKENKNIDYKLDLYNAVINYQKNANENDSLLVVHHNPEDTDVIVCLHNNTEPLIALFAIKDYIKFNEKQDDECYIRIKKLLLEIAINTISNDEKMFNQFIKKLNLGMNLIKEGSKAIKTNGFDAIKFVFESNDGNINTWHTTFDKPVDEIIIEVKDKKNWINGKFNEIYIERQYPNYKKIQLEVIPFNYLVC